MTGRVTTEQLVEARRSLGRQLACLREAAGLTQAQLAKATGYARSAIANVETGRSSQPRTSWIRYDQLLAADGVLLTSHDHYATLIDQHRKQATQERERHRLAKIEMWRQNLHDLGSAAADLSPARHHAIATGGGTVGGVGPTMWPTTVPQQTAELEGDAARPETPPAASSQNLPDELMFETALAGPTGGRGSQPSPTAPAK